MSAIMSTPKFLVSLAKFAKGNQVSLKEFNAKKKAKAQRAKAYAKQVEEKAKTDAKQAKIEAKQVEEKAKTDAKQAKIEAKQAKIEAKQAKIEAKQAKALAKEEAKQAKVLARQTKLEAKQAKALAKQAKLEAKQVKQLAKQTMDQAKELATVELNTPVKTIHTAATVKQEQLLSAPTKTRSTGSRKVAARSSSKKNKKGDATDRVDIIRNLCDQADFCYNGQVSVEITA